MRRVGTNPWMAEAVLCAALSIPTTLRTRTPASVVDVRWVRPDKEKFKPERQGFLAPEGRRWARTPSCACTKTACLCALCQQESHALQEERIKWSQSHGIRVRYCDRRSILFHQSILCDGGVTRGRTRVFHKNTFSTKK